MGSPSQSGMHRPRKEISRGNLLCAKSDLTNLSYPRLESAQKYVTTPDWKNFCTRQPQGARGTAVPLFQEESRGTPSKGFLWATSSRRLDTALLFADKKRGVETIRLAGHCQSTPAPRTTGPAKKPPAAGRQQKKPPYAPPGAKKDLPRGRSFSYFRITLRLHRRARAARGWTARYACAPDRCR